MTKLKKWLIMLVAACAVTFPARAVDEPIYYQLSYNALDQWHFSGASADWDHELNSWFLFQSKYTKTVVEKKYPANGVPDYTKTTTQTATMTATGWTYETKVVVVDSIMGTTTTTSTEQFPVAAEKFQPVLQDVLPTIQRKPLRGLGQKDDDQFGVHDRESYRHTPTKCWEC